MSAASRTRQAERLRLTAGETPRQRYDRARTLAPQKRMLVPGAMARSDAAFRRHLQEVGARQRRESRTRTAKGANIGGQRQGPP